MAMQALRCFLRSRQELASRSISDTLQHTVTYSFAALQVAGTPSSHVHTGNTLPSVYSHVSSSTIPKHLYHFAMSNSQGSGHPYVGGACVGASCPTPRADLLNAVAATHPVYMQTLGDTGWNRQAVYNIPNGISLARLVSGPVIAWLVLNEQWGIALVSLAISGASDWADGYVAKRYNQSSVLGSYLDPLADKVLIGCLVGALGYQGSLPAPLVALIIGRDMVLLSGAFVHRFRAVGWRWPGLAEFFRLASPSLSQPPPTDAAATEAATLRQPAAASISAHSSTGVQGTQNAGHSSMESNTSAAKSIAPVEPGQKAPQKEQLPVGKGSIPPAVFVQPLYISKVNTCFQLLLVGSCLSSSWYAWPLQEAILTVGIITGGTTFASCIAYVRAFLKGSIK